MSRVETDTILIRLPYGDKEPARLEAQIRNGILALLDITCPDHGPNTTLDAVIVDRTPEGVTVELQACCAESLRKGEKSIQLGTTSD